MSSKNRCSATAAQTDTEPPAAERQRRTVPVAERRARDLGGTEPTAAAIDAVRASRGLRTAIGRSSLITIHINILAPLPQVPRHVVQPIPVRRRRALLLVTPPPRFS